MKKFFSMMVAVAAMFTFAACGGDDTTDPAPQPNPGTPTKLEKPVVTITDTKEDGFTVTWEPVANATEYLVYLNSSNQPKTSGTSYTFSNLNAGEYKPRVKALGTGNYTDSDYSDAVTVEITGVSSIDWFTQTLSLAEYDEQTGNAPYNTVNILWQGTGVTELLYGIFAADAIADMTDKQLVNELTGTIDEATLAKVNTPEGAALVCDGLEGGVTYCFCVRVTNENKQEFLVKDEITTGQAEPSEAAAKWLGSWTVDATQAYSLDQNGNGTVIEKNETFTVTIYGSANDPNEVIIDGLSVLGEGLPTYGLVEGDELWILSGVYVGSNEDRSVVNYWVGWYTYAGESFPSIDGYPSAVVTIDAAAAAATSTNVIPMQDENGNPVELVCNCNDIFGIDTVTNGLYFYIEDWPAVYRTGEMTWTKNAAAASALSVAPKAFNANMLQSSVVIAR